MKPDDIKIERGITDITNIMKHLETEAKKKRKDEWKANRRKDAND